MLPLILKIIVSRVVSNKVKSYIDEHTPVGSLKKSFVDNVFKDKVVPVRGSIVQCSLFGVEHTGVYVSNNKIVELLGIGKVRISTPEMFIDGTNAISIYVACNGKEPLGSEDIAQRAMNMVSRTRDYNLLTDNCHQFTAGCINGNFENSDNYFLLLENTIKNSMNNGDSIEWRVWDVR